MKKVLYSIIFSVILLLSFGQKLSAYYYAPDYSYFEWDQNDNKAILLVNRPSTIPTIRIHFHNGHSYVDEACTVQIIGLGWDTSFQGNAISWYPVLDKPDVNTTGGQINLATDNSPTNLSQLIMHLYEAYRRGVNSYLPFANANIEICLHDNYLLDHETETGCTHVTSQQTWALTWQYQYIANNQLYHYPDFGSITIKRKDGLTGTMIDINTRHIVEGELDNINFNPGKVIFDNNTTSNTDIAVNVNHGTLLMAAWCQFVNSKSTPGNKSSYRGTAIRVIDNGLSVHLPAIEIGYDVGGAGTLKVRQNRIGIDLRAGVLRFKMSDTSNPVSMGDNYIAVNMVHGATLGKWSENISSFINTDWVITLEGGTSQWHSGDILFTSGQTRARMLDPDTPWHTALTQADIAAIHFAPDSDLSQSYDIVFDDSLADPSGRTHIEYPLFLLAEPAVYNTRTGHWSATLYNALHVSSAPVQDGDVLVYYGNVREQHGVTISNNLTIRAAKAGSADASVADAPTIDANGYTSSWQNSEGQLKSFITVASGKTLTVGGSDSGPLTVDLNQKGNGFDLSGTLDFKDNYTLKNGKRPSNSTAGGIHVHSAGTLNITGGAILDCAGGNGFGVYQKGIMNLQGNANFGTALPVYLVTDKVITKTGTIGNTENLLVTLEDEVNGRDILISKSGSTSSTNGEVHSSDNNRITMNLVNADTYKSQYNATGNNNTSYNPLNVIELTYQLKDLKIQKTGLAAGDNAIFVVKDNNNTVLFTVTVSGTSNTATIKDLPVKQYTVSEVTNWSWAYTTGTPSLTQNIGSNNTFKFSNAPQTNIADHAEDAKANVFNY